MSEPIVCKPTQWFLLRAGAMILMFGIFAGMFYKDGRWGYREKNQSFYLWKAFEQGAAKFSEVRDKMSPDEWRRFAEEQVVELPEEIDTLPEGTSVPMPWPDLMADYEAMNAGFTNPRKELFDRYRDEVGLAKDAPDRPYSRRKIFEQWVVFWICLVLFLGALAVLLRTMARKVVLDGTTLKPAGGRPVELSDLVRLDLRRWQTKGLAFAWAKGSSGTEQKIRIDGLTYGGFKPDDGEPAEKLMQGIRAGFSGELIDYESVEEEESPEDDAESKSDAS